MNRHVKIIFIFVILIIICLFPIFAQGAAETQSLVTDVESDDIYTLMKVYHFLNLEIQKIEDDFNNMLAEENLTIEQHYATLLTDIDNLKPELWETDAAFQIRIDKLKDSLHEEKVVALAEAKEESDAKRIGPKNIYIEMLNQVIPAIRQERVIENTYLKIEPQEYLRNERKWPISIESTNPENDFASLIAFVDFYEHTNDEKEIRQQIIDFSQAVETNALSASIQWAIELDDINNRFVFVVQCVSFKNNINDLIYHNVYPDGFLTKAYAVTGDNYMASSVLPVSIIADVFISREKFIPNNPTDVYFSREQDITDFYINDYFLIDFYFEIFPENAIKSSVYLQTEDPSLFKLEGHTIKALKTKGATNLILTDSEGLLMKKIPIEIGYIIGDQGPAGGYVFYDAGDYSRGWRYMEVAPEDMNLWDWRTGIEQSWIGSNSDDFHIYTDTVIGSGKQNTIDIASNLKYKDNAAQLCLDYERRGYKDWFLPSIDELDVLTKEFHFWLREGGSYWSSSLGELKLNQTSTKAWCQNARYYSGEKELSPITYYYSIRPIRYF